MKMAIFLSWMEKWSAASGFDIIWGIAKVMGKMPSVYFYDKDIGWAW